MEEFEKRSGLPLSGHRVDLGQGSAAWWPCHVGEGCHVGAGVNLGALCHIGRGVTVGDRSRVQGGAFVGDYCVIEEDAFIGPNATLLNDRYPPTVDRDSWLPCTVRAGAVVGGGATINPGVTVGVGAVVVSGAVATRNVPDGEVWAGVPARFLMTRDEYERKRSECEGVNSLESATQGAFAVVRVEDGAGSPR
jgi:acetyltransferase-like isoleucine patch superfamily enzyme